MSGGRYTDINREGEWWRCTLPVASRYGKILNLGRYRTEREAALVRNAFIRQQQLELPLDEIDE